MQAFSPHRLSPWPTNQLRKNWRLTKRSSHAVWKRNQRGCNQLYSAGSLTERSILNAALAAGERQFSNRLQLQRLQLQRLKILSKRAAQVVALQRKLHRRFEEPKFVASIVPPSFIDVSVQLFA